MRMSIFILALSVALSLPSQSIGYELTTHGLLTYSAYTLSALAPGMPLRRDLGIDVLLADPVAPSRPFGEDYYDFTGADVRRRTANSPGVDGKPFDPSRMPKIENQLSPADDNLRLPGWLMRGAIREDDDTDPSEPNPKDDPFDPPEFQLKHRVMNHFFDPITLAGLSVLGVIGAPAPSWAMGVTPASAFAVPAEDTERGNHFTIYDAREAMYRALTGRSRDQSPVAFADVERKRYWATTFRALGDVVHLVQDMAQPQHTRNDLHAGRGPYQAQPYYLGHKSVFEAYIEGRATGAGEFSYALTPSDKIPISIVPNRLPKTDGYPVPRFARYSDYFSTASSDGVGGGVGMADYSNRGFFTAGRNFSDSRYSLPSRNIGDYQILAFPPVRWDGTPINSTAAVYVYQGTVQDTVLPMQTRSGVALTSKSIWDQFLTTRQRYPYYSLNYINYDAAADLLLPRAVAYSAGLIDYFFRGQLEIALPDEGVYAVVDHAAENQAYSSGFRKIKLKLRNITTDIVPTAGTSKGQSLSQNMNGYVLAVVKYHENRCYSADLAGEFGSLETRSNRGDAEFNDPAKDPSGCRAAEEKITVSDPQASLTLTANAATATALTFTFTNPVPINATDVYLQVVFRGVLGSEQDAVVVATRDISEPTFLTLINVSDYLVCYNGQWYYKNQDGSLPAAIPSSYATALQAQSYATARFAFGGNAAAVSSGALTKPLVVASNLSPGQFARFAILTEPGVIYNDEITGFYAPFPPPYKIQYPSHNQLTVLGNDLPDDPYRLNRDWSAIGKFRNTRYKGLFFGYPKAGSGDCLQTPASTAPADPWKPFPTEPGYAYTPTIKSVSVNFN
jgi:hypothetical protein